MPLSPAEELQRRRTEVRRTRIAYVITVVMRVVLLILVSRFQH